MSPRAGIGLDAIIVLAIMIMKTIMAIAILAMGYHLLINDEAFRWHITGEWLKRPNVAAGDHIWLSGYFYLTGLGMWLFGDSYVFGKLYPLAFSLAGIAGLYALCRQLYESRIAAGLGVFLFAAGGIHTWTSISLMPEPMTMCFWAWGFYGIWRGWATGKTAPALLGAFSIGWSTSLRYEAWIAAGVLSLIWSGRLLWRWYRDVRPGWRDWAVLAGGLVLMNFYIVLWIVTGWMKSGDPLLFLHNSQQETWQADNPFLYLWGNIRIDDGPLFAIALLTTILMLAVGRPLERLFALMVLMFSVLYYYVQMVGTAVSVYRIVQVWRLMLVATIPFPLAWAMRRWPGAAIRRTALAVALVAGTLYFAHQVPVLMRFKLWGFSNSTWTLAGWIRFESNNPVAFMAFPEQQPQITVWYEEGKVDLTQYLILSYISSYDHLSFVTDWAAAREADLVMTLNGLEPPEPGWKIIYHLGEWMVWTRGE